MQFLTKDRAFSKFQSDWGIVMTDGGDCRLVNFNDRELVLYRPKEVKNYFSFLKVRVEDKVQAAFDYWFEHEQATRFWGFAFEPYNSSPFAKKGRLNLFKGWGVEPKAGSCDLFLRHTREVICGGNDQLFEYVIAWIVNLFRDPGERPGVALVLRGGQGTGKGIFANTLGKLVGAHFLHIASSDLLVGRFTGHFAGKLLAFADEAFWAGDKAAEGRLKALITEDRLTVEAKFAKPFQMTNYIRLIIASNEGWVIPANLDERRYLVLDVVESRKGNFGYFDAILKELRNGGYEALLYYFLNEADCDEVELRRPPQTKGLFEQKVQAADPVIRFWYEAVEDGELFEVNEAQGFVLKTSVYSLFKESVQSKWPDSQSNFWRKTSKIFGNLPEKRLRNKSVRTRVVTLPTKVEAEKAIKRVFSGKVRIC